MGTLGTLGLLAEVCETDAAEVMGWETGAATATVDPIAIMEIEASRSKRRIEHLRSAGVDGGLVRLG